MKLGFKILLALLILISNGQSQGFVNLDFESAIITNSSHGTISADNAFPGWTVNAYLVYYDDISLSGESVSIVDTNPPTSFSPIQGKYYAILASGNYPGTGQSISLSQIGTIPLGMQSMTFWGSIGGLQITFAGQSLAFNETGSTANYNIYTADISAYAGQAGELLFSLPPYVASAALDNIQFSATAVPEPGTFTLTAIGGALLLWRMRRKIA